MRVLVGTTLAAPVAEVRAHVRTSRLLLHVAWPLTTFAAVPPTTLPEVWEPGDYPVRLRSLWVLPLGRQTISISYPDGLDGERALRDDGHGQLARRWDHVVRLRPTGAGETLYRDEVDVDAGRLTVPVWLWAQLFYRWRQHRLRRLARRGFADLRP